MKTHVPINLKGFTVESNNATTGDVLRELRELMTWLRNNQNTYYEHHYENLVQELLDVNIVIKGSLNSLGRKLDINPPIPAVYQPYNLAEMFRVSILSKTSAFLQNEVLLNVIQSQENPTPLSVLDAYKKDYPTHKAPSFQFVRQAITRITGSGVVHGRPSSDGVLNFWATDTHYSKVTRTGNDLFFTLKLANIGLVTLKFKLPNKTRFMGDKTTRPNIYLDKKGGVRFGFTIEKELPKSTKTVSTNVLGVDLGLVEPFVGTVLFGDGTHSSPYFANRRTNTYKNKISTLKELGNKLWLKENLNEARGHSHKSAILRTERLRVRSKISRLKVEQSHALANRIIQITEHHNALINLENLNWVPNSTWDQARQQEMIEDKARARAIRVRKINPKNTSNKCNRCGTTVKHSTRAAHCTPCNKTTNRDILASRNIAQNNKPQKSLQTQVTKPATTGALPNYVKPLAHTVQEIQHN